MAVDNLVESIESIVLKGEKYPNGRLYDLQERINERAIAAPLIVSAYRSLKAEQQPLSDAVAGRVYYLARVFAGDDTDYIADKSVAVELSRIANEGRCMARLNVKLEKQEKLGLVYFNERFYAGSVQDWRVGCSASMCTSCKEPVAFGNAQCPNCQLPLLMAYHMPNIKNWSGLNPAQRHEVLENVYDRTLVEFRRAGKDTRAVVSPFNDWLKPQSRMSVK
jgi:hypothetical protein